MAEQDADDLDEGGERVRHGGSGAIRWGSVGRFGGWRRRVVHGSRINSNVRICQSECFGGGGVWVVRVCFVSGLSTRLAETVGDGRAAREKDKTFLPPMYADGRGYVVSVAAAGSKKLVLLALPSTAIRGVGVAPCVSEYLLAGSNRLNRSYCSPQRTQRPAEYARRFPTNGKNCASSALGVLCGKKW